MKLGLSCVLVAVSVPAAAKGDDPKAAATKLVKQQVASLAAMIDETELPEHVYTDDATFSIVNDSVDVGKSGAAQLGDAVLGPCGLHSHSLKDVRAQLAADGQTAVVSFAVHFELKCDVSGEYFDRDERATELAVKTKDGWRIAGGLWSQAMANGPINAAAIKGTMPALDPVADADGDAGLRAALDALLAKGVDDAAAARKELTAIGSGPKEITTSGAAFAKPWKAAWVSKALATGHVRAEVAPSGTTGWAVANVMLAKKKGGDSYVIPFRVLFVFDKNGDAWSLVHVTFAVPSPSS
ncbi:MAG TPA: nuclear transport factor 2 family protein [Kofleriaceae bacterium]|jgi:ketosteroid isomerase-like protein|nr:nuclear transport factor 2 family protein [Kofleriaceae bacterium]